MDWGQNLEVIIQMAFKFIRSDKITKGINVDNEYSDYSQVLLPGGHSIRGQGEEEQAIKETQKE